MELTQEHFDQYLSDQIHNVTKQVTEVTSKLDGKVSKEELKTALQEQSQEFKSYTDAAVQKITEAIKANMAK